MRITRTLGLGRNGTPRWMERACRRRWCAISAVLLALTLVGSARSALAAPAEAGGKRSFETLTANLYVGGGISRAIALDPSDPNYGANLVRTVTEIYQEIAASQPAVRLERVAQEIASRMPDIVAVEEASLIRAGGNLALGGPSPSTTVVFDYLQLLIESLQAMGAPYAVAVTGEEIDVEMPMIVNLSPLQFGDVRLTDREAILVRTDLPVNQLQVSNPQSSHFANVITTGAGGRELRVLRGWCAVDVEMRGQAFRYVCTHLEEETVPALQALQARDLLSGPANVEWPVMIVGDFNLDPFRRDGSSAYDLFPAAGFTDAWAASNPADLYGGLTWGHDEFLADPGTAFNRRIDLVFFRSAIFEAKQARVIDLSLDRAQPPLWASDHAALTAHLLISAEK